MEIFNKLKSKLLCELIKPFTDVKYKVRRWVIIKAIVWKLEKIKEDGKMKSWRTTVAGVGTILASVGFALKAIFDGDPTTNVDFPVLVAGITAGIGLITARDNKVSSEEAGAK